MKPLYVLDVETTGIDTEKAQLLQLAIVKFDSLDKKNEEYERLNLFVKYDKISYLEPKALSVIGDLLKQATEENTKGLQAVRIAFTEFLCKHAQPGEKFVLAGKNLGSFDLKILKNHGFELFNMSHRIMDVGSLYYSDFGYVPSLEEINNLIGKESVKHEALSDCYNVIDAIKYKMKK